VNVRWWSSTITSRFSTRVCSTAAGAQGASTVSPPPHFEKTTCAGTLAHDDKAECGILSVPENRSSEKSRMIHLPVVVLHSRAPGAPRDAVLFMTGGPGLSSTSNVPASRDVIFPEDRDYVVLEQRGALNADPALACPEMVAAAISPDIPSFENGNIFTRDMNLPLGSFGCPLPVKMNIALFGRPEASSRLRKASTASRVMLSASSIMNRYNRGFTPVPPTTLLEGAYHLAPSTQLSQRNGVLVLLTIRSPMCSHSEGLY